MAGKQFLVRKALSFFSKFQLKRQANPSSFQFRHKGSHATHSEFHKLASLLQKPQELSNKTLVFHLESALLRSSSLFPYFMLVAFEAGGLLRAFILFLLYPLVCLVGEEQGINFMVFVSFAGIKRKKFMVGSSVLPKYFLEDVGDEGFDAVMKAKRKIAVSDMPRIMIECFLKDYLRVDAVEGRELKTVCGYFVGLMEGKNANGVILNELRVGSHVIGIGSFNKSTDDQLFSYCKEIYWVSKAEKWNWKSLPREKYPKPLIFHDGRLAFRPTLVATLIMFMWLPLGVLVFLIRFICGVFLPLNISAIVSASTGLSTTVSRAKRLSWIASNKNDKKESGVLYVCNHRTLLDPIFVAIALMKPLAAVTYSVSRFSEVTSPIKVVRLTRDHERDRKVMEQQLSQGDLVVCPEGTTCREPYLLRFSPLFAEMTGDIVPVAVDLQVSMFYGTTASGCKCLDSIFNLLNPFVIYSLKILEKLPSSQTCIAGGKSRTEVANHVQNQIAKALGFECTTLTRKDKYMILAGNDGII